MRGNVFNFEQLYKENKKELLEDEDKVEQLELRLERRQANLVAAKRNRRK